MKSRRRAFNLFLGLAAALLLAGCATSEERKQRKDYSNLRVHVESEQSRDRSSAVTVFRENPIRINVEGEPVIDEHDVVSAAVVDQPGGTFSIQVRLNRHGTWTLERVTVMARGRHLVIFSYFGQSRWLAAPEITGKNSTGMLTFTPDATREEAERIVRGLNNVAKKLVKKENWPWSSER
jgi:hypothetical protein